MGRLRKNHGKNGISIKKNLQIKSNNTITPAPSKVMENIIGKTTGTNSHIGSTAVRLANNEGDANNGQNVTFEDNGTLVLDQNINQGAGGLFSKAITQSKVQIMTSLG